MKASVVEVTPEMASEWLKHNLNNRSPKPQAIAAYAHDMRHGAWQMTGDAIRFDADGTLVDGQNRLMACVQAGVSFPTLVLRGLDPKAADVMDTGSKRTVSDQLKRHGERNANVLAAVIVTDLTCERHGIEHGFHGPGGRRSTVTVTDALRHLEENPWLRDSAARGLLVYRELPEVTPSLAAGVHARLRRVDAEDADVFVEFLAKGLCDREDDPIRVLRSTLVKNAHSNDRLRLTQRYKAAICFKAWNLWRNGDFCKRISWTPGGSRKEPFPIPR